MGCDIHLIAQVRNADGKWETVEVKSRCIWCEPGKVRPDCYWCKGTGLQAGFHDRNYALFGILAGVRRDDIEPIAPRRGLPLDVTEDSADLGEHSFSWLTLAELQAYGWDASSGQGCSFHSDFMPALAKLGKPDDVRIVFGFDS